MSITKDIAVSDGGAPVSASTAPAAGHRPFGARQFGQVNWLGVWTLYKKEVRRFLKVAFQTVFAPVISTLLFLAVFVAAWGDRPPIALSGEMISFLAFLPPGLIMMSILNNAFANSSSSLIIAKVQGNLVDMLMPPLSAAEIAAALMGGAATRGVLVGIVTAATTAVFVMGAEPMGVANFWVVLYFGVMAAVMMSAAGVIAGIWAEKFDQLAAVTNFLVTPLTMLSGTFFSVHSPVIPGFVAQVSAFNPFFYVIDGFRYGFVGASDADPAVGAIVVLALNLALVYGCYRMLKSGYKLKT